MDLYRVLLRRTFWLREKPERSTRIGGEKCPSTNIAVKTVRSKWKYWLVPEPARRRYVPTAAVPGWKDGYLCPT